jgi:hypothetical protein
VGPVLRSVLGPKDGWALRIWSFGYACMLELYGPPDVIVEYLEEVDPENTIQKYLDNIRKARARDELE